MPPMRPIVSGVRGELREGQTPLHALASVLPMGTVSGAPKVRACQIIAEIGRAHV